jgi:hypothetical protein
MILNTNLSKVILNIKNNFHHYFRIISRFSHQNQYNNIKKFLKFSQFTELSKTVLSIRKLNGWQRWL